MGDSCYNHKRAMVVILILVGVGIATYFYMSRPKNDSSAALSRKNRSSNMDSVTYDFNGNWTTLDYSNKIISLPLKDTNDDLIIVSGALNKSFDIHLDFLDKRKSCTIDTNATYNSFSDHSAYVLGDGKVIVSFKNNLMDRKNVVASAFNVEWRIFVIDPINCSYHNLTVTKGDNLERVVSVLPYYDTFDVVMDNDKGALPKTLLVRYDNHCSVIKKFPVFIDDDRLNKFHMIKANDASQGYYYIAHNPKDTTKSIFKKFNDKFENVENHEFSSGIYDDDSFFTLSHGRFSVCSYDSHERKNLTCQVLDAGTFNETLTIANVFSEDRPIYYVTVANLLGGDFLVFYVKRMDDLSFIVYVQKVNGAGKVEKPVEIGHVEKLQYIYPFEMKNGSFLVAVSTIKSLMTKLIVAKNQ